MASTIKPFMLEDVLWKIYNYREETARLDRVIYNQEYVNLDFKTIRNLIIGDLNDDKYETFLKKFKETADIFLRSVSRKNTNESIEVRNQGNKLLHRADHDYAVHDDIWRLYSKSIALAYPGSEELAYGYGNRSFLLMHFHRYQDCINDIDKALAITKNQKLKSKLLFRKLTCLANLSSSPENYKMWNETKQKIEKLDEELRDMKTLKNIEKMRNKPSSSQSSDKPKPKRPDPFVSESIAVAYDKKTGRHLVASKAIKPGELLMVLKPFVNSINANKSHAYCSNCFKLTYSSIPCDYCHLNMYCSEACKTKSQEDYRFHECTTISLFKVTNRFATQYEMAIKSLLIGVKEAGSIAKLRDDVMNFENSPDDYLKKACIDDNQCNSFMNIISLPSTCTKPLMIQHIKSALILLTALIQETHFFGKRYFGKKLTNGTDLADDDEVVFIGTLLVKLLAIFSIKAEQQLTTALKECPKNSNPMVCVKNFCCMRGSYITALGNYLPNDCNPNAYSCLTEEGYVMYFASRAIPVAERITLAHFETFFNQPREIRRSNLQETLFGLCQCRACTEDWPLHHQLMHDFTREIELYHSRPTGTREEREKKNLICRLFSKYVMLNRELKNDNWDVNDAMLKEVASDITLASESLKPPSYLLSVMMNFLTIISLRYYGCVKPLVPHSCGIKKDEC